MKFLLGAALLVCACKHDPPRDCSAEMADFRAFAKMMADSAPAACNMRTAKGMDLVSLDAADLELLGKPDKLLRATIITIDKNAITLDGQPEWQAPQPLEKLTRTLGADLATLRDNYRMIHPDIPFNGISIFQIHRDAPWSLVIEAMRVVQQAKYPKISIGFERPLGITAPPPSSIDLQVTAAARDGNPVRIAQVVRTGFAKCQPAIAAIAAQAARDEDDRLKAIFEQVPNATESCGCSVDFAAAKQLLWLLHPRFGCAMLYVTADGNAPRTEAAADAPWSTVYRNVIKAARADASGRLNPAVR